MEAITIRNKIQVRLSKSAVACSIIL